MFIATKLIGAIVTRSTNVQRHAKQDLESVLWVLLYVVYKNAVDEGGAGKWDATRRKNLSDEFDRLFSAPSADKLLVARASFPALSKEHQVLYDYTKEVSVQGNNLFAVVSRAIATLREIGISLGLSSTDLALQPPGALSRFSGEYAVTYDVIDWVLGAFWDSEPTEAPGPL